MVIHGSSGGPKRRFSIDKLRVEIVVRRPLRTAIHIGRFLSLETRPGAELVPKIELAYGGAR